MKKTKQDSQRKDLVAEAIETKQCSAKDEAVNALADMVRQIEALQSATNKRIDEKRDTEDVARDSWCTFTQDTKVQAQITAGLFEFKFYYDNYTAYYNQNLTPTAIIEVSSKYLTTYGDVAEDAVLLKWDRLNDTEAFLAMVNRFRFLLSVEGGNMSTAANTFVVDLFEDIAKTYERYASSFEE